MNIGGFVSLEYSGGLGRVIRVTRSPEGVGETVVRVLWEGGVSTAHWESKLLTVDGPPVELLLAEWLLS